MVIAIYAGNWLKKEEGSVLDQLIVQTLSSCFYSHNRHEFVLLNPGKGVGPGSKQSDHCNMKPEPKGAIGKKLWWDLTLPKGLKKLKADLFIAIGDRCSLKTPVSQCLIINGTRKVKQQFLQKAGAIVVFSESIKQTLLAQRPPIAGKIFLVEPSPGSEFKSITEQRKEEIKESFSEGKEFFLYDHSAGSDENLIELLKAFSLFKKRLESGLKLLIIGRVISPIEKNLANYKYRHDVNWINEEQKADIIEITASAYATIIPFNSDGAVFTALNAMAAGSPVITSKSSDVHQLAGESVLPADTNSSKSISEKMMQIYIDENLRSALIEKGQLTVRHFTLKRSTEQMWQAFMKALN